MPYYQEQFIQLGYPTVQVDSFYLTSYYNDTTYHTWQYNIIASVTGTTSPDSIYVIGAHYDATLNSGNPWIYTPGADDDAGGVASLFELARVMKTRNFQSKSTIQFIAFGAEELNMDGSNNYTQKAAITGKKIKWMLNHDMILDLHRTDRLESEHHGLCNFNGPAMNAQRVCDYTHAWEQQTIPPTIKKATAITSFSGVIRPFS